MKLIIVYRSRYPNYRMGFRCVYVFSHRVNTCIIGNRYLLPLF